VANNDVRSEGMSYGMMIALQYDKKHEFDALWNWAKTYMWHGDPTHPFYEYFAWSLSTDGSANSEGPAPDGEEYFAMALYFASGRWGNGAGIYNYRAEADRIVSAMKNRQPITGRSFTWRSGVNDDTTGVAMFHPQHKMVRFSPNQGYFETENGDHTDPSYHLPAFYELWARFGPEADREFWREAARISRDFFQAAAHPVTALTPDYAYFDGTALASSWDQNTACFRSDAHRTAMNWSMDWAWWRADPREQALSDKLQTFFLGQGPGYAALYQLDGTPLEEDNYTSKGLQAMNATSAMSATDPAKSEELVYDLWHMGIPQGEYRYYDGMLYMFALLHVSGEFRIYIPK
jgi:oligosaccharide reducing-end xylanase